MTLPERISIYTAEEMAHFNRLAYDGISTEQPTLCPDKRIDAGNFTPDPVQMEIDFSEAVGLADEWDHQSFDGIKPGRRPKGSPK